MIRIFLIILGLTSICYSQITVSNGTTLYIGNGASLIIKTLNDTLLIENGGEVVNNGIIDLDTAGFISEIGSPITGNGYEVISKPFYTNNNYLNIGGLGFTLRPITSINNLSVLRRHLSTNINNNASIERSFELSSNSSSGNIDLNLEYHYSELNSNTESNLLLFKSIDNGISYNTIPSINDSINNLNASTNVSINGIYTLNDTLSSLFNIVENNNIAKIYPIPALFNESIFIKTNNNKKSCLKLYSPEGKLLLTNNFIDSFTLSLTLPKGVYYASILNGSNFTTKKIIIN